MFEANYGLRNELILDYCIKITIELATLCHKLL